MRAMVLTAPGRLSLEQDFPLPKPDTGQVLVRVRACAVCRTDLHVVDGELTGPKRPVIPGHEIVGEIIAARPDCAVYCAMGDTRPVEAIADVQRLLAAGINVVGSAPVTLQHPWQVFPQQVIDEVEQAARDGGASLFITGVDPGFANDLIMPPSWAAAMDIGKKYAGSLSATMNMIGCAGSGIGPIVIGYLRTLGGSWNIIFYAAAAAYLMGFLCWLFLDPVTPIEPEETVA